MGWRTSRSLATPHELDRYADGDHSDYLHGFRSTGRGTLTFFLTSEISRVLGYPCASLPDAFFFGDPGFAGGPIHDLDQFALPKPTYPVSGKDCSRSRVDGVTAHRMNGNSLTVHDLIRLFRAPIDSIGYCDRNSDHWVGNFTFRPNEVLERQGSNGGSAGAFSVVSQRTAGSAQSVKSVWS